MRQYEHAQNAMLEVFMRGGRSSPDQMDAALKELEEFWKESEYTMTMLSGIWRLEETGLREAKLKTDLGFTLDDCHTIHTRESTCETPSPFGRWSEL